MGDCVSRPHTRLFGNPDLSRVQSREHAEASEFLFCPQRCVMIRTPVKGNWMAVIAEQTDRTTSGSGTAAKGQSLRREAGKP